MVDVSRLAKISSDARVDEPHDLWSERRFGFDTDILTTKP
jgi:hypothetical protein